MYVEEIFHNLNGHYIDLSYAYTAKVDRICQRTDLIRIFEEYVLINMMKQKLLNKMPAAGDVGNQSLHPPDTPHSDWVMDDIEAVWDWQEKDDVSNSLAEVVSSVDDLIGNLENCTVDFANGEWPDENNDDDGDEWKDDEETPEALNLQVELKLQYDEELKRLFVTTSGMFFSLVF